MTHKPPQARFRPRLASWLALVTVLWGASSLSPLPTLSPLSPRSANAQSSDPLLDKLSAARFIPAESIYVGAFDGFQQAYDRLGAASIISEYKTFYDQGVKEVVTATGHNLLDISVWRDLGLSIDQPVGGAIISINDESGLFFASTHDGPLLAKNLRDIISRSGGKVADLSTPDATLLCEDKSRKDICFAIKDSHVLLIISGKGKADSLSKHLLSLSLPESISGHPIYKDAAKAIPHAQLASLLQPAPIQKLISDELASVSSNPELKASQDALAAAKKRGAPTDEIERLEDDLRWQQRWIERQLAELKVADHIFSGLRSIIMDVQALPSSLEGHLIAQYSGASFIASAFSSSPATPKIYASLDALPLFLATAHVDPTKVKEIISLMAATEGESIDEFARKLKTEISLDLDADIFDALNGQLGFAITADTKAILASTSGSNPEKHFGGSITIGFKDPAALQKLLDTLTAHPGFSKLAIKSGTYWGVDNPWRKVWFGAVGDTLLITTDEPAFARLAANGRGLLDKLPNPALQKLLDRKDTAASVVFNQSLLTIMMTFATRRYEEAMPSLPKGATADQKKAYDDLIALNKELSTLRDARERSTNDRFAKLSDLLGPQAFTLHVSPTQIEVHGGLFFTTPSLADLVKASVRVGVETATDPLDAKISDLNSRRWELERLLYP
jgi:hypothetical protein